MDYFRNIFTTDCMEDTDGRGVDILWLMGQYYDIATRGVKSWPGKALWRTTALD